MAGNKVQSDGAIYSDVSKRMTPDLEVALDQHFKQLLKDWRKSQQKKHGERVEARQQDAS